MGASAILEGAEVLVIGLSPAQDVVFRADGQTIMVIQVVPDPCPEANDHGLRAVIHAPAWLRIDRRKRRETAESH